jgi:uncharacterized protein (DUF488 family)
VTVYTIGHSTHPLSRLLELLRGARIRCLADVRSVPRSRRVPQFNRESLAQDLPAAGIDYLCIPELGGWRSPEPGSHANAGWRNRSFRGYADHMRSDEFADGLARLTEAAASAPTAVMCAEAAWWRCHRRLVADALVARGWEVCHIGPEGRLSRHELTEFAVVGEGGALSYPARDGDQLRL